MDRVRAQRIDGSEPNRWASGLQLPPRHELPPFLKVLQSVKVPIARICKYLKITYTVGGRYLGGHGHGPGERWRAQSTGRAEQLRRAGASRFGQLRAPGRRMCSVR